MYPGRKYAPMLEELAKSEPQIQAVILTDLAGIVKGAIKRTTTSTPTPNVDQLHGFLGCVIAQSYVEMGVNYALNKLQTVIVEYHRGTILLTPTSVGVFMVLADPGANLGFIRHKMTRIAKKLHKLESKLETLQLPSSPSIPSDSDTKPFPSPPPGEEHRPEEQNEPVDDKESLERALRALDSL